MTGCCAGEPDSETHPPNAFKARCRLSITAVFLFLLFGTQIAD